jgi:hypothetical protein
MAVWAMHNGLSCRVCYQQRKVLYGCDIEVSPYRIEDYQVTHCPVKDLGGAESGYLQAYFEYQNGFLPNSGGWLDQPMKFTQAIFLIDKLMDKLQGEKNA